jgi:hypothetical protein
MVCVTNALAFIAGKNDCLQINFAPEMQLNSSLGPIPQSKVCMFTIGGIYQT